MAPKARLGQQEESNEQNDGGHGALKALYVGIRGDIGDRVTDGQSQNDGSEKRHRDAPKPADDRSRIGIDDQEGQGAGREGDGGSNEDARQRRQHTADDPCRSGAANTARTIEDREPAIIHRCPHGDAEPRPVEQEPQPDGHGESHDQHDQIVVGDTDRAQDQRVPGVEGRQDPEGLGIPDPLGGAHHTQGEGQGDDEFCRLGGPLEAAHDSDLENDPQERSQDEQAHSHGQEGVPAPSDMHLPVGESRQHADGSVRPIEDARRGVREGQSARRDGVDAGCRQSPDGEDDEVVHRSDGCPLLPRPAGPSRREPYILYRGRRVTPVKEPVTSARRSRTPAENQASRHRAYCIQDPEEGR